MTLSVYKYPVDYINNNEYIFLKFGLQFMLLFMYVVVF